MLDAMAQHLNLTELFIFGLTCLGTAVAFLYRNVFRSVVATLREAFSSLQKIPELESRVKTIHQYVSPNGGSSILDTVKRVEAAVAAVKINIDLLADTLRAQNDTDEVVGRFHTLPDGANDYVNQTYARMLRVGKPELLGWNFLNFIHPDDVSRVKLHWDQCREENRQYRMQHRMVTSEGDCIEVSVIATPIPENGSPRMWVGTIRRVDVTAHTGCPLGIKERNSDKI